MSGIRLFFSSENLVRSLLPGACCTLPVRSLPCCQACRAAGPVFTQPCWEAERPGKLLPHVQLGNLLRSCCAQSAPHVRFRRHACVPTHGPCLQRAPTRRVRPRQRPTWRRPGRACSVSCRRRAPPRACCAARQGMRALDSRLRGMPALLPASAARLSPLLPKPACLLAYAAHAALLCRVWAEMTWRPSTCCCSFWAGALWPRPACMPPSAGPAVRRKCCAHCFTAVVRRPTTHTPLCPAGQPWVSLLPPPPAGCTTAQQNLRWARWR